MSKPRLRAATSADLPFVERCARAAYAPYVARIGREPAPMVADFASHLTDGDLTIIETEKTVAVVAEAVVTHRKVDVGDLVWIPQREEVVDVVAAVAKIEI